MLGLALEGGGARGAFHMGAVKALLEAGYQFDGVAGTSIGALNGALIVQGDFEAGYRMWESLSNSLIFEVDEAQIKKVLNKKIDRETRAFLTTKIKEIIENKGIDTSRIRQLLDQIIDEDKIRRSPTDFGIVTVSVSDLKPFELYKEDIPQGKMTEYLMASANYPAFKIEPIDGKFYIDGGFYDNLPANLLVRKGYKDIVMIRTFAIGKVRKLQDEHVNTIKIMPSEDLGSILNFNHNTILT
ncbi:MAG TPA: patatin, partial [Ruminiclostridium sp.]|nr:patatin [Ruminiclostridium sp.]